MSATPLVRAMTKPLIYLVVLAAALVTMLMMETSGAKHAPSLLPFKTVANHTATSNTPSNGNTSHCTDGHGQDASHNPHCRGISSS